MPRTTVVFVHGFLSSASTWDSFRALLEADSEVSNGFDLATFSLRHTGVPDQSGEADPRSGYRR